MKNSLLVFLMIGFSQIGYAQKTEFPAHEERARFEQNTSGITIEYSNYEIVKGPIDEDLKLLIIELMEREMGFISVEFVNDEHVIIQHQSDVTDEMIEKTLNRKGKTFQKRRITQLPIHR